MHQVIAHQAYHADVRTTRINSADVAQMLVSSHSSAIVLYALRRLRASILQPSFHLTFRRRLMSLDLLTVPIV